MSDDNSIVFCGIDRLFFVCFCKGAISLYIPNSNVEGFQFFNILIVIMLLLILAILVNMKSYLLVVLIYIFLVADYIDYLFMCLLVISITSLDKKEYSDDFPILKIRIFFL